MLNWLISSIQQYTVNQLRISFSLNYDVSDISKLKYSLINEEGIDKTDQLKSITDSNDWEYVTESNYFNIELEKNSFLDTGLYSFILYNEYNEEVYNTSFSINYMEDVRTKISNVYISSLNTLEIDFESLYEDLYQTKKMMSIMNFSIRDDNNQNYSDSFELLSDVISIIDENDYIKHLTINLKDGCVLPKGYYNIRLTSQYKNRTFSIIENRFNIPFMTTTPPTISGCHISKNSDNEVILTISFGSFMEKSMFNDAKRMIINSNNEDITSHFDSDRVSPTSFSTAGVSYITKLEIPLVEEFYTVEKGIYTVKYVWDYPYFDNISGLLNANWCLNELAFIKLNKLDNIQCKLGESIPYNSMKELNYIIELNGNSVTDENILSAFSEIKFEKVESEAADIYVQKFYIDIINKSKLVDGTYSFIIYRDIDDDRSYEYIGNINIKSEITPKIKSVYQSSIDTLTVVLNNELPIEVIEYCTPVLFDSYGGIDFSSRLTSIRDSNVWEAGQTSTDRFNIVINSTDTLLSGKYLFSLNFDGVDLEKNNLVLSYMETRKGLIQSIEQTSLSTIEIDFSQSQSRQFLLTTKLSVERRSDGANFTDRFELLENVIKSDQYIIDKLEIPMDHEDSLPAGRYTFSFIFQKDNKMDIIYSYDVELGYMTNVLPSISRITNSIDSNGLLNLKINFSNYLESDLFNIANIRIEDTQGNDVTNNFISKSDWSKTTTYNKEIILIKSLSFSALNKDITFEKDNYYVIFSWEDTIDFMPELVNKVNIDYILPSTTVNEVVDTNPENKTARLYFEFPETLQFSFYKDLKVEVIDESGEDHTDYFDSIQKSNNISSEMPESEKIPTNNINLDINNISDLSFGNYTFIFYHVNDNGIRTSEFIGKLDIMAALYPSIKSMEQVGTDMLLITLVSAVPRKLLESNTFTFISFKKTNYTNYFKSIDSSNDWNEEIREVSSFYLKLKNGYTIGSGTYSFVMYSGQLRLDQCDMSIDYMEGTEISIETTKMINLSKLALTFSSEQSVLLFKTLKMVITDENGNDVSDKFVSLDKMIQNIETDYFESLYLEVLDGCHIPSGNYTIEILKKNNTIDDSVLMSHMVSLHFMSSIRPELYNVSATKSENIGNAILMWFSPAIELNQFTNAVFSFTNASGMSVKNRFDDISNAILDVKEKDGITFINYATLPFNHNYTLDKDTYDISFDWVDEYSYMKKISCEVSLDYILFPVKSIELDGTDSVLITFNEYISKEYLMNAKLIVDSTYSKSTIDGNMITDVDFTDCFLSLSESNDFDEMQDQILSIKVKVKDGKILPNSDYRFIIAEDKSTESQTILQYAYAGMLTVDIFISENITDCKTAIRQKSYNQLEMKFDIPQNIEFLNSAIFHISKETTDKIYDFSSMFVNLVESNKYDILDENGNIIDFGYYKNTVNRDIIIDEIHYSISETPSVIIKLTDTGAIPSGNYKLWLEVKNEKYFESEVNLLFMTNTPPEISGMTIEKNHLVISFNPYAEVENLLESNFKIISYRGLDSNGIIKGDDISSYFGNILSASMTKVSTDIGITYVSQIYLPISNDAFIASGKYIIYWNWSDRSLFNQSKFIGSLSVIAKGIKNATLVDAETIKVELNEYYKPYFINSLSLSVINSNGIDVSDYFKEISECNSDINDLDEVDTFIIKVDESTDVITDTYTFSLSYDTEGEDDDQIKTTAVVFGMNIVYMTDEFPSVSRLDNLTNERFIVDKISNSNASSYIGLNVQLLDSDEKEILTEDNLEEYMNKYSKIFPNVSIDRLILELNEEISPCLLFSLNPMILDSDGNDMSYKFCDIDSSNSIKERNVLNFIEITFNTVRSVSYLMNSEFTITNCCGIDISDKFLSIDESNNFENESVSKLKLIVNDDDIIEEYETINMKLAIKDSDDNVIVGYSYKVSFRKIQTSKTIDLVLKNGETLEPDTYDVSMYYYNEPNSDSSIMITPFIFSGDLPFISRNVGKIESVSAVDLTKLKITFTEDLPIKLFYKLSPVIYNEDKDDVSSYFKQITDSNQLDGVSHISELPEPYSIYLELDSGNSLLSANYTIGFEMDINSSGDSEEESDTYTLWQYTVSLPYMINEISNNIKSIEMCGINKLKVKLENPIDIHLLKSFLIEAENEDTGAYYSSETFKRINTSNNLGKYVLLTDNRYILYSEDSISWYRLDTGFSYTFYDIIYDEINNEYIVTCANGKLLFFKEFSKNSITLYDTGVGKSLTSIIKIKDYYLITGNDGVILKCEINGSHVSCTSMTTNVTHTINKITKKSDDELVAVGYNGTILYSDNGGNTWSKVPYATTSITPNFTNAIYYDGYFDSETSEWVIPEITGFIIVGTNGSILYSESGSSGFKRITSPTTKSLYGISYHNDTIVIVGDSGTIVATNDTETWDLISSGSSSTLRNVSWCDSKFITCAANGKWLTSISGVSWTSNSSIYSDGLKNIKYMPSQYIDNRNIDYFYIELNNKQELGSVSLYSGTEIPTMINEPSKYWISDETKKSHIGDIYTRYSDTTDSSNIIGEYQYTKETEYDESGNISSEEYIWKDCTNLSTLTKFSTNYLFYILIDDESDTEWNRIGNVPITYLTSDPGEIVSVSIKSPDEIAGVDYDAPYLSVEINRGNENAIYYSSYEFMDSNGNDFTDKFMSLRQSEIKYSTGLSINGINIRGNKDKQINLSNGNYIFNWKWTPNDSIEIPVSVKSISNIIKSITRDNLTSNKLIVTFTKEIDLKYFYNTLGSSGTNISKIDIKLYKYPTNTDSDASFNYFNYFKDLSDSTNFSDSTICRNNKVNKIILEVDENSMLPSGNYLFKMTNEDYSLDDETTMYISSTKFSVTQEVTTILPTLASVKVENCKTVITPMSSIPANKSYSGLCSPYMDSTMVNLLSSWKLSGNEELNSHVGDKYTDETMNKEYGFTYDKLYGTYQWEEIVDNPMLVISFDNKPILSNLTHSVREISLVEYDSDNNYLKDMTNSLKSDIINWEFDITKSGGISYVSKAYIPLDPATSFYGPSNATFTLHWITDCVYNDLSLDHLSLSSSIKSYGDISSMKPISIPPLSSIYDEGERTTVKITEKNHGTYVGKVVSLISGSNKGKLVLLSETNYEDYIGKTVELYTQEEVFLVNSTGMQIMFTQHLYTSFLKKCTFTLTREYEQEDGSLTEEDVAGCFQTIASANVEDFENNTTANSIYLLLQDGQSIEPGHYDLIITGEKSSDDLSRNDAEIVILTLGNYKKYLNASIRIENSTDDLVILTDDELSEGFYEKFLNKSIEVYTTTVNFIFENMLVPWTTSRAPSDINVKYYKTMSGFNYPVLRITFNRETPDLSIVKSFKVGVYGAKKGKDYSDCFRACNSTIIRYNMTDTYDGIVKLTGSNYYKYYDKAVKIVGSSSKPVPLTKSNVKTYVNHNVEYYSAVQSIDIPMKSARALKAASYTVNLEFTGNKLFSSLPVNGVTKTITVDTPVMSRIGNITKISKYSNYKLRFDITFNSAINTDSKLKKSQLGIALNAKTKKGIFKNCNLIVLNEDGEDISSYFNSINVSKSSKVIKVAVKTNKIIDPQKVSFVFKYNGVAITNTKTLNNFTGIIRNNLGKMQDKSVCYILEEIFNGKTRYRVYSRYSYMKSRVNTLKKLNNAAADQYALCKKCRKKKAFSTSKISATFDAYDIPKGKKRTIVRMMQAFMRNFIKKTAKPKACTNYKWSVVVGDEPNSLSFECKNYVKSKTPYEWHMHIANKATKLNGSSKTMYIAYLVQNGERFPVVFRAKSTGKKSKSCKTYVSKKLPKYIKAYNKKVSTCNKCKKRTIAYKSSKTIGWGSALFADDIRLYKNVDAICNKVNTAFKLKKMGCTKASFSLVQKNSKYCKLSCKNCKIADKSLASGCYKGTFKK